MLDVQRCINHLIHECKFVQSDPADVARHGRMVSLVEQMLSLHKQLTQAQTAPREDGTATPHRGHRRADRRPGLRALRAHAGGDRDRGGSGQVNEPAKGFKAERRDTYLAIEHESEYTQGARKENGAS